MIIVKLQGGLGNQMFQYALGRALSLRYSVSLRLDTSFYNSKSTPKRQYDLDVFNITGKILDKKEIPFIYRICQKSKFLNKIIINKGKEKFFHFDSRVFSLGKNLYLDGYWQSPKYFKGYEDVIRKDFTFKNKLNQNIIDLAEEIKKTNSLSIHIRRGDYLGSRLHVVQDNEYYKKGIEYILEKTPIEKIYVFSDLDDINWCKDNLSFDIPTMFVGTEYAGLKGEGHMFLMSQCRHFIIANSSFSWWGAWLANYEKKIVICPKQWFRDTMINTDDLIPEDWIRI